VKETKQERREKRRAKGKAKMPQHGKSLARIYRDAVRKRVEEDGESKDKAGLWTCPSSFLVTGVEFEPTPYGILVQQSATKLLQQS
jgi:hypothetical protein